MHGCLRAASFVALLLGCLAAVPAAGTSAQPDVAIVVTGNRRVDAAMIRSHFHPGPDGGLDAAALDAGLKELYATGLFANVDISRHGDQVVVAVAENPPIARLAFEGNKKIKDEDLKKAVQAKAGGPLSRTTVHDDVQQIIALYRQRGYFDVHVEPKTIATKDDRVSLVFEIKEGDKLAVRQILFAGNAAYPANKLKGVIKSGETNLLSFLLDNDIYDADRIESDRDALRRFYLAHGYADVRVRAAASYEADKKGVVLTFNIDGGPQYRLGRVEVESRIAAVPADGLRQYLRSKAGDIYDADAVDKTVEDMTMGLARRGAPFAAVLARKDRRPERRLIDIVYAVAEGRRVYIERINIHGNVKTRDAVIRREFEFGEGDAYNRALIDRGERRLNQLGYFKTVKIGTQPGSAPDRVVVDVAVEEQKTGEFFISGGYSTAAGALVQVTIGDRNFLGLGDYAKASVMYGQYARGFDLAFIDPYAFGPRLSLGGELFGNQTFASSYQSYDSTLYGAKASLGTPLTDDLAMQWNYTIYNQRVSLGPSAVPVSLPIRQAAQAGPMWVSSIGNGLIYGTLDNPRTPTAGVRVQVGNEFAGLGGAAKFARTTEDVRYYHEIFGDVVGMARAQGGYVTPWGGQKLPLLNGFFGGPQLVRGFAPNGFGPRDLTPGTTHDNVGGNVYWATTAELQAPVPFVPADAQLKVALFADAGSLWATGASSATSLSGAQIANASALRSSVGAGLVWDSMFGPIRLDYAFPLIKQSYDVTQRLSFTAGGF